MSPNTVNSNNPCLYLNISSAYISNHCRDFCAKQSLIVCPSIPNNSHIDQKLVTRTECLNVVCKPQMMEYKRSFQHSGVSNWNNVPVHVQHSPSVNVFKARYLKWVQNQGIPE